jgi:hypothetical protein
VKYYRKYQLVKHQLKKHPVVEKSGSNNDELNLSDFASSSDEGEYETKV